MNPPDRALTQRLAPAKGGLVPGAHAEFVENGDVLAVRAEGVDRLLGVIGVLRLGSMLHHGHANPGIDELLYSQQMRSSAVGLAEQCFDGREVACGRVHVDDVVQIVIGVDVTALQLKAAVVARLPVCIHAIDRSEQPRQVAQRYPGHQSGGMCRSWNPILNPLCRALLLHDFGTPKRRF